MLIILLCFVVLVTTEEPELEEDAKEGVGELLRLRLCTVALDSH